MSRSLNPNLFGPTEAPAMKVEGASIPAKKIRELEAQIEAASNKMDRYVQILEQKFQHLQHGQKVIAEQIKQTHEGFSKQVANLYSKMNERRVSEARTQELFDRHNQLVQNFDVRMGQMQKVCNEQEMKLMSYQATYDEILREIRSLKGR